MTETRAEDIFSELNVDIPSFEVVKKTPGYKALLSKSKKMLRDGLAQDISGTEGRDRFLNLIDQIKLDGEFNNWTQGTHIKRESEFGLFLTNKAVPPCLLAIALFEIQGKTREEGKDIFNVVTPVKDSNIFYGLYLGSRSEYGHEGIIVMSGNANGEKQLYALRAEDFYAWVDTYSKNELSVEYAKACYLRRLLVSEK